MQLIKDTTEIKLQKPTVVTIGTFDGIHIGHRKIIEQLLKAAEAHGLKSTILTFFPHPRMVLQQNVGLQLINTIEERIKILQKTGIDNLIVYPFTKEFSRLEAQDYIEQVLIDQLNAKRVIIGYDHHFGRNRTADIHDMHHFGKQYDFEVEEIPEQDIDNVSVSSTKIRKALKKGNLEKANRYLGAPFILTGKVIKGKQLGQKIGFATANIHIAEDYKLIPKNGVYVVQTEIDGKRYYGMMNIGTNPTVGGIGQSIETHLFGWNEELYGRQLTMEIHTRIRDEKNFSDIKALIAAMERDEQFSKKFIRTHLDA